MSIAAETMAAPADIVAERLQHYARRGVFRGFSRRPAKGGTARFRILWHRDRMFELVLDTKKGTLRFPVVLPNVQKDSEMHAAFKDFLKSRQSEDLPEHRRIDRERADVRPYNRGGDISLTLTVKDGDYDYGAQKLIHLVHEIYLDFLCDGRYRGYMIDNLGLDPDLD